MVDGATRRQGASDKNMDLNICSGASGLDDENNRDLPIIIDSGGLDNVIPKIPETKESYFVLCFRVKTLDSIDNEPNYAVLINVRRQLAQHSLAITSSFRRVKQEHLELVLKPTLYKKYIISCVDCSGNQGCVPSS